MYTLKHIESQETYPLRSEVLRWNKIPPEKCGNPEDSLEGSFHIAYLEQEQILGIASFSIELMPYQNETGLMYRLRGMAVSPHHQNKGIGKALLAFGIEELKKKQALYVWCNARTSAKYFYESFHFETFSEEFDIPEIGPHYRMRLKLTH